MEHLEFGAGRGHFSASGRRTDIELHVALVASLDGLRFTAVDRSAEGLLQRLSEYVAANAHTGLWPDSARRVRLLLTQSDSAAAIQHYFDRVGDRWDPEYLHREVVQVSSSTQR